MIEMRLDELGLSGEAWRRLRAVVEATQGDGTFEEHFARIAKTALLEYVDMLLGRQLPTRADEIRERRLFLLLKHYFGGRIPGETEVAQMFQLNERQSSHLLRNVRVKNKFELEHELMSTLHAILASATREAEGGPYTVVITSSMMVEELRQTVTRIAPTLDQVAKVPSAASVYSIPADTYQALVEHFEPARREAAAGVEGRGEMRGPLIHSGF